MNLYSFSTGIKSEIKEILLILIMDHAMKVEFVWGNITEDLKKEVVAFWSAEQAILDEEKAKKRANELVAICRKSGELVGVVTHVKYLYQPLQNYFHLRRTFVKESARNQGVMKALFQEIWKIFSEKKIYEAEGIVGIMGVQENPHLNSRNTAVWTEYGNNVLIGLDSRGFQIRASYFEGAKLTLPKQSQGAPS